MTGKKLLMLIVAALVVIALISSVTFTVDETQSAIVTRFGRPVGDVLGPGLHFKAPWPVDRVLRMDARLLVFDNEPMEMLTNDKKNVLIDSFLTWRIADPLRFTQTVRTKAEAEARLLDISSAKMGDAVGARKMDEFLNVETSKVKMREIAQEVAKQVDSQTRDTMGVQIVDLQINGFDLPTQNRNSVILRMRAERDRIATRYKSEGDQEALRIEAEAAAEEQRILAEAKAKAESVRGSGEADALKIFADAYTQDPEFYRFLRSLDSYETLIDEDTTIVIESDSPLLDTLNGK